MSDIRVERVQASAAELLGDARGDTIASPVLPDLRLTSQIPGRC